MGGSVSVNGHVRESFGSFMLLLDNIVKRDGKIPDINELTHELWVFLEDFVANDEQFNRFNDNERKRFIAGFCYCFNSLPLDKDCDKNELTRQCAVTDAMMNALCDGIDAKKLCEVYMSEFFSWDGKAFYKWENNAWKVCLPEEVNCLELVNKQSERSLIPDFDSNIVFEGVDLMHKFACAVNECASAFTNEEYEKLLDEKSHVDTFNTDKSIIPCYSKVVDLSTGRVRKHCPTDLFTKRIEYDPCTEESPIVEKFTSKYDATEFATLLLNCGGNYNKKGKRLTIISGPGNSGKTTILNVIKALFGPYVAYENNYSEHVRTCLFDRDTLPSEKVIADHPCDHIVVTATELEMSGKYAGRDVTTFKVKKHEDLSNIVPRITTRKQLGCLLNWCIKNVEFSGDSMHSMLMALQRMVEAAEDESEDKSDNEENEK